MAENNSKKQKNPPSVFISYSYDSEEHKAWVKSLAEKLRAHGVETVLDQWDLELGDNIPYFIEKAIKETDYTIIVCTPNYKKKSENREGGVGYETYIITNSIFNDLSENIKNSRFIPVLREGRWTESAPIWIAGNLGADLSGDELNKDEYEKLLYTGMRTMLVKMKWTCSL